MNFFSLIETPFIRLISKEEQPKEEGVKLPKLQLAYREFVVTVMKMCADTKCKGYAIGALMVVEIEVAHLQSESMRNAVNNALTGFISRSLDFIRNTISHIKNFDFCLVPDEDSVEAIDLRWDKNKCDIIELAYAFKVANCFGENVPIKDILNKLCKDFGVEVDENYAYKKFAELKVRARESRSYFIDFLGERLRGFMAEQDEK